MARFVPSVDVLGPLEGRVLLGAAIQHVRPGSSELLEAELVPVVPALVAQKAPDGAPESSALNARSLRGVPVLG